MTNKTKLASSVLRKAIRAGTVMPHVHLNKDGTLVPHRKHLLSADKRFLYDPISDKKFRMLARYVRVVYGLTMNQYRELCGLTDTQLPNTAPGYRDEKSEYAIWQGLGTNANKSGKQSKSVRFWHRTLVKTGQDLPRYAA